MEPARRALAPTALAAAALALVAGCSATNPYTTTEGYQPDDAEMVDLGEAHVASLMVISEVEGGPGNLVARLVNAGTEPLTISLTADGPTTLDETFEVAPETTLAVGPDEEVEVLIDSVAEIPGELIPMTVTSSDGSSEQVTVPVLTGNFERYATLVPTPEPTVVVVPPGDEPPVVLVPEDGDEDENDPPSPTSAAGVTPTPDTAD